LICDSPTRITRSIVEKSAQGQAEPIEMMGCTKKSQREEQADQDTAYLNRLAVLPEFRHCGIGSRLVDHIIRLAEEKNIGIISIGIIAEHTQLKEWYIGHGFKMILS